ncbi:MAG TPA: GNAT family N-acetyltransferase [Telluria sp.]|jgi:ribosomal protein S18 acetylase RimI-like enzyme
MHPLLSNPVWESLCTTHAAWARECGALKRFMPDVAPFCAVEHDGMDVRATACLQAGETVYFLGPTPALPPGWTAVQAFAVLQMVYGGSPQAATGGQARLLGPDDIEAMLGLTALVYPEFFRPRTAVLGAYIGHYVEGRLAAMAGQRMACPGYREISAVCTHPAHRGEGHAGRLIAQLSQAILAQGEIPFLHVSASNRSAWALYERLGFVPGRTLSCSKVRADV